MDHKYLKDSAYDWTKDKRKLKINGIIPDARCFHCGRIFLNADHAIVFCVQCDKAMSMMKDGPDHDYDEWGNKVQYKDGTTVKLTARREIRTPIDFDKEHEYFNKSEKADSNFMFASGKVVRTEDPEDDATNRLYDIR